MTLIVLFLIGLAFFLGWRANDWLFGPRRKELQSYMAAMLLHQQQGQEQAIRNGRTHWVSLSSDKGEGE